MKRERERKDCWWKRESGKNRTLGIPLLIALEGNCNKNNNIKRPESKSKRKGYWEEHFCANGKFGIHSFASDYIEDFWNYVTEEDSLKSEEQRTKKEKKDYQQRVPHQNHTGD